MVTRRTFLQRSSATAAGLATFGTPGLRSSLLALPVLRRIDATNRVETDPDVRILALRALDAARAAGAIYADVRLTRTLAQNTFGPTVAMGRGTVPFGDSELYGVGVRVLVGGAWGFAASPYWELDEVVKLAQDAVGQAKHNAAGGAPPIEMGKIPPVSGTWSTPIRIDPFTVPIEEREELLGAWMELAKQSFRGARNYLRASGQISPAASFTRQERAVATTDGSYFTQTIHHTSSAFEYRLTDTRTERAAKVLARNLGTLGGGWETYLDAGVPDQFPTLLEEAKELLSRPPAQAGDVGRYDVVFDAATMASIVNATVGMSTQLDRAMGYEANAGGTSYLNDPLGMLGTYRVSAPLFTITANRSMPKGLATVQWDDEGVTPEEFTLVKDGLLTDYQTTREQSAWLAPYYQKNGRTIQSHGCAAADSALNTTMQHSPNLALTPGTSDIGFSDLVRDTKRGLVVLSGGVATDFQGQAGLGSGSIREIIDGKLGTELGGLAFSFTSAELLKSFIALGGRSSIEQHASGGVKGQPSQMMSHTVSVVPAKAANVTFIDPRRKA